MIQNVFGRSLKHQATFASHSIGSVEGDCAMKLGRPDLSKHGDTWIVPDVETGRTRRSVTARFENSIQDDPRITNASEIAPSTGSTAFGGATIRIDSPTICDLHVTFMCPDHNTVRSADVQLPPRSEVKLDYCSPFHPKKGPSVSLFAL